MEFRASIAVAAATGVMLAGAGFLLAGGRSQAAAIADLERRASLVSVRRASTTSPVQGFALAALPPLFPTLAGPNAPPEIAVVLEGIVRTPDRIAALLSIAGAPAQWFSLGEVRDGVTLEAVDASSVSINTNRGRRQVSLGSGAPPAAGTAVDEDAPPPGVRLPPEPASAAP